MSMQQTRLQVTHMEIVGTMKSTYEVFKNDGQDVGDIQCYYHTITSSFVGLFYYTSIPTKTSKAYFILCLMTGSSPLGAIH